MFVSLRNCGFLDDNLFVQALEERIDDPVLRGRIWRVWTLCWSLSTRWTKRGSIVDCGTYNGKAFISACKYARLKTSQPNPSGAIVCADIFENPPEESRKRDHSSHLHKDVERLFAEFENCSIIKGTLPGSIRDHAGIDEIGWAQIDLNSAVADVSVLEFIYPRLCEGAHVILDDYGFSRYRDTQNSVDLFLENKPERVFELPTGQGLLIKQ